MLSFGPTLLMFLDIFRHNINTFLRILFGDYAIYCSSFMLLKNLEICGRQNPRFAIEEKFDSCKLYSSLMSISS